MFRLNLPVWVVGHGTLKQKDKWSLPNYSTFEPKQRLRLINLSMIWHGVIKNNFSFDG